MRRIFATICLMLGFGLPAAADTDVCPAPEDTVSRKVIADLIGWIALHTDYDVAEAFATPPQISFCFIGDTLAYEDRLIHVEPFVRATYDLSRYEIRLVSPWDEGDAEDRSVLLHELVHVVQLENRDWPCVGAPEWEAYVLQTAYLGQYGIDPHFNWAAIYMLSRCPEPSK